MDISVIIPVFNHGKYVTDAVNSALAQPETAEILLIEDGSTDDSVDVCRSLENQHEKVRLLLHQNGAHGGIQRTRNLGIHSARCEYIAFLDADDRYLPGRFTTARELLRDPTVDGVYEALGTFFENEQAKEKFLGQNRTALTTMPKPYGGFALFKAIATARGFTHLNGLVIRKSALYKVDGFDNALDMHGDTNILLKLTACTRLIPGRITEPVAERRVHGENRILTNPWQMDRMWRQTCAWFYAKKFDNTYTDIALSALLVLELGNYDFMGLRRGCSRLTKLAAMVIRIPKVATSSIFWAAVGHVFGRMGRSVRGRVLPMPGKS